LNLTKRRHEATAGNFEKLHYDLLTQFSRICTDFDARNLLCVQSRLPEHHLALSEALR
jgi:hypothetical protein